MKTSLREVLLGYEAWDLPYPGDPRLLKAEQRTANLAHVLSIKPVRIARLQAALPGLGPLLGQLLDPQVHPFEAVLELDRWWVATGLQLRLFPPVAGGWHSLLFPKRFHAANAVLAQARWAEWREHPLVAPLDALLRDIALVVGDAIVLRRPDFEWTVNLDPVDRRDLMDNWGHVVVMRAARPHLPAQAFDLFELARASYGQLHHRRRNRLRLDAVDVGGGDWRGTCIGWTAVAVVDGRVTQDHYPHGRDGLCVPGVWSSSPAGS